MAGGRSAVRRLAFSRVISITGSDAAFVALAFEIFRLTNSTIWLSAALLLTFGITGLLRPIAGWLGDRFNRRRLMVTSEVLGAVAFAGLALVHSPGSLLIVAFLASVIATPFGPAGTASIPNLIASEDELAWANSRIAMSATIGGTIGPAIGGGLAAAADAGWVFWLNAASFAVSAAIIAGIRGRFSNERGTEAEEASRGVLAGFRRIRADPLLLGIAAAWTLMYFAVDLVLVGDLPLSRIFGVGAFGYGLFLTVWSAGAFIGYWAGGRLTAAREVPALLSGTVMVVVGYAITGVSPWFAVALMGVGIAGGFDALGGIAGYTMIQRRTPDEIRARVFGSISSLGLTANTMAFVVAGFLVGALGPRAVYGIGAGVALVATAVLLRLVPSAADAADLAE